MPGVPNRWTRVADLVGIKWKADWRRPGQLGRYAAAQDARLLQIKDEGVPMRPASYVVLSSLLILFSYLVFRVKVRSDYERGGRLFAVSTLLECLVFCLHANLSYTFLPARWPALPSLPDNEFHSAVGLGILAIGTVITLWSMISLGLRKALGQQTGSLYRSGFYQYIRNPQIAVYGLVVVGVAFLWPSCIVWDGF
jgi:hypothetical protein